MSIQKPATWATHHPLWRKKKKKGKKVRTKKGDFGVFAVAVCSTSSRHSNHKVNAVVFPLRPLTTTINIAFIFEGRRLGFLVCQPRGAFCIIYSIVPSMYAYEGRKVNAPPSLWFRGCAVETPLFSAVISENRKRASLYTVQYPR